MGIHEITALQCEPTASFGPSEPFFSAQACPFIFKSVEKRKKEQLKNNGGVNPFAMLYIHFKNKLRAKELVSKGKFWFHPLTVLAADSQLCGQSLKINCLIACSCFLSS